LVFNINHFDSHVSELLVDAPKQLVKVLCALIAVGQSENLNDLMPLGQLAHLILSARFLLIGIIHYRFFLSAKV
jgi:hypothetical protein